MYPAPQKEIHGTGCSAREVYREQLSVSARPQEAKTGALALVVRMGGGGIFFFRFQNVEEVILGQIDLSRLP
jgi:hypothetical protein